MQRAALRALRDNREGTDAVGQAHVPWDGPSWVAIVDSVCAFFGVADLADVPMRPWLSRASASRGKKPPNEPLRLTFDLRLRMTGGASLGEFIESLDYRMNSRTDGTMVVETRFVDFD